MTFRVGAWSEIIWDPWPTAAFLFIVLGWIIFAYLFIFGKKPPKEADAKKAPASRVGIAL